MEGWIKLHRKILDSPIFSDPDLLRLWIFCLVKAAYKETTFLIEKQEVELHPGQFVTGRFSLHAEFNAGVAPRKKIKDTTLWSWLKRLETYGNLDIKSYNKYSVVTVVKWSEYQESLTTEPQQIDNSLTTEPQQTDTNKNLKNYKELTTATATIAVADDSEMTVMDAYTQSFGGLFMTGLIQGYVHDIQKKGVSDSFLVELFLETGESSAKPNLKLLRAIGDSWLEKGITSREQSRQAKQKQLAEAGSRRSASKSYSNQSGKKPIEIAQPGGGEVASSEEMEAMMETARRIKESKQGGTR